MQLVLITIGVILFASVTVLAADDDDSSDSDETTTVALTTPKPTTESVAAASGDGDKKKGKDKKGVKKDKKTNQKEIKPANESLILGMYRLTSDPKAEDFKEFLKAMEYSKQDREKVRNSYMITVTIEKGWKKNEYSYNVFLGFSVTTDKFKLGEEYDARLFDGRSYKATVYMSENVVTREEKHEDFEARHEAKFSRQGFEIELSAKNKTAKQKYERAGGGQGNFFESVKNGFANFFNG